MAPARPLVCAFAGKAENVVKRKEIAITVTGAIWRRFLILASSAKRHRYCRPWLVQNPHFGDRASNIPMIFMRYHADCGNSGRHLSGIYNQSTAIIGCTGYRGNLSEGS